ncbi:MgtC/SapB family protein [Cucumibacter marinus]|uniref:MgtC/SapB family protein n=1 Tax=Cucumibacter marinus TaxID=1121252 RepID=UPI00041A2714|nr:MgtC/SapB family protein [Cucumibacter marinus]
MDWIFEISAQSTTIPEPVIVVRLLAAAGLGAVIGLEREAHNRAAGLRTHMLVALAAALFTTISLELYHFVRQNGDGLPADPIRAIEAVTAGVAFLGAGSIIRRDGSVHGLTTGAGMWLSGAIGLACATGYLLIAAVAAGMALIVLWLLRKLEGAATKSKQAG